MENQYGRDISNLLKFQSKMKEDVHRLWDNVHDMQEVGNITSKNIEEMYDKDILTLHNFKTKTTNQMVKLHKEMDAFIKSMQGGVWDVNDLSANVLPNIHGLAEGDPITAVSMKAALDSLEEEMENMNSILTEQQQNDNIFRKQLQDVFEDVDHLKGTQRMMKQEQERTKMEIRRLKAEDMTDVTNKLEEHGEGLKEFRKFQRKSDKQKKSRNELDNEKLLLVINEITKLKNQMYYLQQSILLLRANGQGGVMDEVADEQINTNVQSDTPATTMIQSTSIFPVGLTAVDPSLEGDVNNVISQLNQRVDSCATKLEMYEISQRMEVSTNNCFEEIENTKNKWNSDKNIVEGYIKKNVTKIKKRLTRVAKRLDVAESNTKKYNLIISGIPKTRKLERVMHLEKAIKRFFQNILGLSSDVQFDEVQRVDRNDGNENSNVANGEIQDDEAKRNGIEKRHPVLIKFPSVRMKTIVMKASRNLPANIRQKYSVGEDFSETVKRHRRVLVAFARKRSRITKKKWALKYDELFMNGRIFVFDEERNRVLPKN